MVNKCTKLFHFHPHRTINPEARLSIRRLQINSRQKITQTNVFTNKSFIYVEWRWIVVSAQQWHPSRLPRIPNRLLIIESYALAIEDRVRWQISVYSRTH